MFKDNTYSLSYEKNYFYNSKNQNSVISKVFFSLSLYNN